MENTKYGKRREGRWTPIRAKAQDTRANPNSWETHLVRKRCDIGLLRALSPRFMTMSLSINEYYLYNHSNWTRWCRGMFCALQPEGRGFVLPQATAYTVTLDKLLTHNCL